MYSEVYSSYLDKIHKAIVSKVFVGACPYTWYVLLTYLGVEVIEPQVVFYEDNFVVNLSREKITQLPRHVLESLCTLRPEVNESLWRVDNVWKLGKKTFDKSFHVGTMNSYGRFEFKSYLRLLFSFNYCPMHTKVLLLPCSADKPYPSKDQAHVISLYPDHDILFISGYLGVTPFELRDSMPFYDASIPNYGRVYKILKSFLKRYNWLEYVSYVDFYGEVVKAVVPNVVEKVKYKKVFSHKYFNLGSI